MSEKIARMVRKATKKASDRAGWEYVEAMCAYGLSTKLRYCWYILTHGVKK